jgi:hypothetical protein
LEADQCRASDIDTPGRLHYTESMTHHHHETGHVHPARAVSASLLRMSAPGRLIVALVLAGVLWIAVWLVML